MRSADFPKPNAQMDGNVSTSGWTSIDGIAGCTWGNCSIVNCVSAGTVTTSNKSDAGCYFVGQVDASADKITAEELYYVAKTEGLPVSKGVGLKATATTGAKTTLEKLASTMSAYARKQPFSGVTLTTWKYNDTNIAPKNYINLLSVAGSVFGVNTLTVAVVIGIVLLGFVTATMVLYVKKKKTKSQIDPKRQ